MQREGKNYSITSKSSRLPKSIGDFDFGKLVEKVLGRGKFVSFVFISDKKMKELNMNYRRMNKSTDILSFPNPDGGEIFLSPSDIGKKSSSYSVTRDSYFGFLLIHGLLHLKGFDHGSKMDEQEKRFCKIFSIPNPFNVTQNNSRHRHRHLRSPSSSRPPRSRGRIS